METESVTIQVDAGAAQAFTEASSEEKRKLQLLLSLRLRELTSLPRRSLKAVMDEIGRNAADRGMSPTVLDSILHGN